MYTETVPQLTLCEFIKAFLYSFGVTENDERVEKFYQEATQACSCDWSEVSHTYEEWLDKVLK